MKVLAILIACVALAAADCDVSLLKKCVGGFLSDCGISGIPPTLEEFAADLGKLLAKGTKGFDQICSAGHNAKACLGAQEKTCMTVPAMSQAGVDPANAAGVISLFYGFSYLCLSGHQTVVDNLDCILKTHAAHRADLIKCEQTFMATIMKDPSKTCDAGKVYEKCVNDIYKSCNDATAKVMSGSIAAGLNVLAGCGAPAKRSLQDIIDKAKSMIGNVPKQFCDKCHQLVGKLDNELKQAESSGSAKKAVEKLCLFFKALGEDDTYNYCKTTIDKTTEHALKQAIPFLEPTSFCKKILICK